MSRFHITYSFLCVSVCFGLAGFFAHAQEASDLVETRRAQLKTELTNLEQQIAGFNILISGKQKEASSLERDIAIIDAEIKRAKLEIRRRNLAITGLASSIDQKSLSISEMSEKIDRERVSLAESLRKLHEYDSVSLMELLLGYEDVSDFFVEVDAIDSLQVAIQSSFDELRADIVRTGDARENLQKEKQEQTELRALQEIEKRQEEAKEAQKQSILKATRGQEANYRQLADVRRQRAASIRSELFLLQGSPAISFEEALRHAEFASAKTGVRPAFILGIIAQESELGRNIGQCNLPDDPPKYKWQSVMKPSRDHAPYLAVTQELGLDPNAMPVSCPMRDSSGGQVGWGGAMGPAQFIPSTWILYKDAVSGITGNNPANPWTPRDAFMASGLLLRDNGAVGGRAAELKAAAKYFAGGNWDSYLGRSYANQVLAKVDTYQEQITFLKSLAQQ